MPVLEITEEQILSLLRKMPAPQRERLFVLSTTTPSGEETSIVPNKPRPLFGGGKNDIAYMADDFDAPLDEFKDYMP